MIDGYRLRLVTLVRVSLLGLAMLGCDPTVEPDAGRPDAATPDAGPVPTEHVADFIVHGESLYHWTGSSYERMFVRGVNLGVGMPGTHPGELAPEYDDYLRWFEQMKAMGFDVVRIYTLHYPRFHRALRDYNEAHPSDPLYVLQGIWLTEENPEPSQGLHGLTENFERLIDETIDAAHGDAVIAERRGRAWGTFDVDISPWVMGYIVGREVHAEEALTTDAAFPEDTSYEGTQLRLASGSPSSVWAAARLDYALRREWERYGRRTPMAFANWMELDPLTHRTEPSSSRKDVVSIDLIDAELIDVPQGIFFSYHVYPYFPRFISEQPEYQTVTDELGIDSYLGYLRELQAHHRGRALMVTEFGVPSSWGLAQLASSGMHHGGHTEEEQGIYAARMLRDIVETGCAGAIYFHWMDGWFKRVWIHHERAFPADRMPLWHDLMNPQQSYGLVAFELPPPDFGRWPASEGDGRVLRVEADADAEAFRVRIELASPLTPDETLWVGYDTYGDALGERVLPTGAISPLRIEHLLSIGGAVVEDDEDAERARLTVMASYDPYTINGASSPLPSLFRSTTADGEGFRPIVYNTTGARESDDGVFRFPALDWEAGRLRVRRDAGAASSHDAVLVEGSTVTVSVPWSLLQFTDPSALQVLSDDVATEGVRETETTEGIAVVVSLGDAVVATPRFLWERWDRAPETTERLKRSAEILAEALASIPAYPDR
jgi:hypothetical protein